MTIAPYLAPPRSPEVSCPRAQVEALARDLLGGEGTRLTHMRTAGFVATKLSVLFGPGDAELLVAAALLHDIGYSARIAHTGFHPWTAVSSQERRESPTASRGWWPTTRWRA
jgi:hypothetical protein